MEGRKISVTRHLVKRRSSVVCKMHICIPFTSKARVLLSEMFLIRLNVYEPV